MLAQDIADALLPDHLDAGKTFALDFERTERVPPGLFKLRAPPPPLAQSRDGAAAPVGQDRCQPR